MRWVLMLHTLEIWIWTTLLLVMMMKCSNAVKLFIAFYGFTVYIWIYMFVEIVEIDGMRGSFIIHYLVSSLLRRFVSEA